MAPKVFCIGGPLDGKWKAYEGRTFSVATIPQRLITAEEFENDSATVTHEIVTYKVHGFHTPDGDANLATVEGGPLEALNLLVEAYQASR